MTPVVPEPVAAHLWIVGAGRTGLSLALRLHRAHAVPAMTVTGRKPKTPPHPMFKGRPSAARYRSAIERPDPDPDAIVIAVPDGAIDEVADRLATLGLPTSIPVLHTSGSRSVDVLRALAERGHPVGSVHPLAALADPISGADRLAGATWGVEGEGAARALAERIIHACGGRALPIAPGGKPSYHAAAVFASNYAVVLLAVAERLMEEAGVHAEDARPALAGLAAGAVENLAARGPAAALTGPILRGDEETVALHLARLSADERALYCLLGREALRLARSAGLDAAAADRIEHLLGEGR
ncbi:Rossmann-like and DUF2520 domain-containing protein [Longimicrobium sp.]|uniref:Rossmann-like and DUF2520 domain-containing protein n=1 Tax=Longimicrobium sp. TaxID=2029185 RepID=UPI002E320168|nr:DUF2520 domain-containing protein [Longimicrobium sp.]HEX6039740.1 DUF2520 domain-containing protein [Longimicrobium sp.]